MLSVASASGCVKSAEVGAAVVLTRLGQLARLAPDAKAAIEGLTGLHLHRPSAELVSENQANAKGSFVVSGWAARTRILPDGRRQLFGFVLPGDGIGICQRPHPLAPTSTVALTQVETLSAPPFERLSQETVPASLASALHVSASLHEAYLLNQVMRLGRLTAYERTCHLFMELWDRLKLAGLATDERMPMPLTQEVLADINGLSTVHVNRVLQQLRRDNLVKVGSGQVVLLDPDALASIGNYVPPVISRWV